MSSFSPETNPLIAALPFLPGAALITDVQGIIRSANPALTSLTGYKSEEIVGQSISLLWFGSPPHRFDEIFQKASQLREPWRGEWTYRRRSGEPFTVEQVVTPIQNPGDETICVLVAIEDISARRKLEEELRLAKGHLRYVEQTVGAGTWEWTFVTRQLEGSPEWSRLHGLHLQGTTLNWDAFAAILHPEDRDDVDSWFQAALEDQTLEYRVVLPDGHVSWIKISRDRIYSEEQPVQMAGICVDVTERKLLDHLAAEAQRDFERFFNLMPDLACVVSTDGYFKKVNPAWEITLGYPLEEVLRTPMLDFVHPDDLDRTLNEIGKQSREYRTRHFINRYRCKNGSYRLFDWTTTFNRDHSTRFGVARDITDQRLSEESLRESEERFRIMADSCPTIIWVTNAEGRTRLANRMCSEFFGAMFEQADDGLSRLLIHPDDFQEYVGAFLRAVRDRSSFRAEARVRRWDGEWRWIASYAEPRLSLGGDFLGHVGISPDITDRKQSEVALQKAKDVAESANRSKSEFLANMSHEIRTPMNGVIGLTDLVLETELTAEQRGYLEIVRSSADSLLRILNDILDFSKIEAGKLEFEIVEFDLHQMVDATLKVLGIRAAAKNLELACDLAPDIPSRLLGDPGRLRQILVNLIGNAIKFTECGEVVLSGELVLETAGELELHFSVRDTGIGIPLNKQQHVFRAFAQADSSSTRTFGGTGLGLTISSQLVDLMGGRIWLESQEGIGSTFHFTVRQGRAPEDAELPAANSFLKGQSVLVVDDNQTTRRILERVLSNAGLKTMSADSEAAAREALSLAADAGNPIRLIVLDLQMPGMDGFALAQSIKTDPRFGQVDIVLLTSGVQRGDPDRCRELGISSFLTKPVGHVELLAALHRVSQSRAAAGLQSHVAEPPAAGATPSLRLLVVEDNPVNRLVAIRLLEKANHTVWAATNGQEALEMAHNQEFDCVLMDVQMPVLDGFQATAAIRSEERISGGHLPIIAMTAHAMAGDLERCLAAGMDDYLTKPIKKKEVLATVDRVIRALKTGPNEASNG